MSVSEILFLNSNIMMMMMMMSKAMHALPLRNAQTTDMSAVCCLLFSSERKTKV